MYLRMYCTSCRSHVQYYNNIMYVLLENRSFLLLHITIGLSFGYPFKVQCSTCMHIHVCTFMYTHVHIPSEMNDANANVPYTYCMRLCHVECAHTTPFEHNYGKKITKFYSDLHHHATQQHHCIKNKNIGFPKRGNPIKQETPASLTSEDRMTMSFRT